MTSSHWQSTCFHLLHLLSIFGSRCFFPSTVHCKACYTTPRDCNCLYLTIKQVYQGCYQYSNSSKSFESLIRTIYPPIPLRNLIKQKSCNPNQMYYQYLIFMFDISPTNLLLIHSWDKSCTDWRYFLFQFLTFEE